MAAKSRWSPYRIAALAVALGGVVALYYGYTFWSGVAVFLSLGLGKRAQGYSPPPPATNKDSVSYVPLLKRPGRGLWIATGVSSLLAVLSFLVFRSDAIHGFHQLWPVYAFAVTGLVAPLVWFRVYQRLKGQP